MSTHPYIPLYVDDFEAATAHLTAEEDGVYNRLLRLCWRTPGCSIPSDDGWIARKVRLSVGDFERIARPVLTEFFRLQRGRYIQKRLKAEYDDISRKKSARRNAGKSGGLAKAAKTKGTAASIATALPADTRAFPYPEPEPKIEERQEAALVLVGGLDARKTPPSAASTKGHRLPGDWHPTIEGMVYAAKAGFDPDGVARMIERFRNYWHAKAGRDAAKLDWHKTWCNWVATEAERRGAKRPATAGPGVW